MGWRTALAAGTATAGLLAPLAPPAVAAPTAPAAPAALPGPDLTGRRVTPSTCPGGQETLAGARRPTFTATAPGAGPDTRMRFEIWPRYIVTITTPGEEPEKPRPTASGLVAATTPGGRTFSWRPGVRLVEGPEYIWRARLSVDGVPASAWSSWRMVMVEGGFPRIHECRFSPQELREARAAAQEQGWSLRRQLADELWISAFHRLARRIERANPAAYTAAEVSDAHAREGWIAFRAGLPAKARALVTEFRTDRPSSRLEILTGRDFDPFVVQRRADLLLDLAETHRLVGRYPVAGVDLRTGTVELELVRRAGSGMTGRQFRRAVLAELRAKVEGWTVVPSGDGVLASATRQPVRIVVVDKERWSW